ncbi:MAG: hypothetical protein K4571_04920 [Deltaproteobacteria bacterium]
MYGKWQPAPVEREKPQASVINNQRPRGDRKQENTVPDKSKPLTFVVLACLILFCCFFLIRDYGDRIPFLRQTYFTFYKSNTLEYRLEKTVDEANKRCPMTDLNGIRIDKFYYDTGNIITTSLTLTDISYRDLPSYGRESVLEKAKIYGLNLIRQNEKLRIFADHQVSMVIIVKTKETFEYDRISIKPMDY